MCKVGEFSKLAKTTIKTLGIMTSWIIESKFIDDNGYRYYERKDLISFK